MNKNMATFDEFVRNGRRAFGDLTWSKAVERGQTDRRLLANFNSFRRRVVDELLTQVMRQQGCTETTCVNASVGSDNLDSDYDITVYGPKSADIIEEFNARFLRLFNNVPSATVFDTNLYGIGAMSPVTTYPQSPHFIRVGYKDKKRNDITLELVKPSSHPSRAQRDQHVWALVKLAQYWQPESASWFPSQWSTLWKEARIILNSENNQSDSISLANEKYVSCLRRVHEIREKLERTPVENAESNRLRDVYKFAVSHANFHAQESYYTFGAFKHVVLMNQAGARIANDNCEYLDSMIENVAGAIHMMEKLSKRSCQDAMLKASKYMMRFMEARDKIDPSRPMDSEFKNAYIMRTSKNDKEVHTAFERLTQAMTLAENDEPMCIVGAQKAFLAALRTVLYSHTVLGEFDENGGSVASRVWHAHLSGLAKSAKHSGTVE